MTAAASWTPMTDMFETFVMDEVHKTEGSRRKSIEFDDAFKSTQASEWSTSLKHNVRIITRKGDKILIDKKLLAIRGEEFKRTLRRKGAPRAIYSTLKLIIDDNRHKKDSCIFI